MKYKLYADELFLQGADDIGRLATKHVSMVMMWYRQMVAENCKFPLRLVIKESDTPVLAAKVNATTRFLAWKEVANIASMSSAMTTKTLPE